MVTIERPQVRGVKWEWLVDRNPGRQMKIANAAAIRAQLGQCYDEGQPMPYIFNTTA
jgi:hypothetical protein